MSELEKHEELPSQETYLKEIIPRLVGSLSLSLEVWRGVNNISQLEVWLENCDNQLRLTETEILPDYWQAQSSLSKERHYAVLQHRGDLVQVESVKKHDVRTGEIFVWSDNVLRDDLLWRKVSKQNGINLDSLEARYFNSIQGSVEITDEPPIQQLITKRIYKDSLLSIYRENKVINQLSPTARPERLSKEYNLHLKMLAEGEYFILNYLIVDGKVADLDRCRFFNFERRLVDNQPGNSFQKLSIISSADSLLLYLNHHQSNKTAVQKINLEKVFTSKPQN